MAGGQVTNCLRVGVPRLRRGARPKAARATHPYQTNSTGSRSVLTGHKLSRTVHSCYYGTVYHHVFIFLFTFASSHVSQSLMVTDCLVLYQ